MSAVDRRPEQSLATLGPGAFGLVDHNDLRVGSKDQAPADGDVGRRNEFGAKPRELGLDLGRAGRGSGPDQKKLVPPP